MSGFRCAGLVHAYPGSLPAGGGAEPVRAVNGIDLEAGGGELVCVIGPNGSGKSTLLKCLAGLLQPEAGEIRIGSEPLASLDPRERARRIAVVPQFLPALHDIAVRDFVLGGRYAHFGRWSGPGERDQSVTLGALEAADVLDLQARMMSELSGGQRQRVLVARAIAQESELMLVDEPTSSLDPDHQIQVFDLIAHTVGQDRTALVVTHDLNLAAQYATRVVLLDAGLVVADGPPGEVISPGVLGSIYGDSLRFGALDDEDGQGPRPFVLPWRRMRRDD